MRRRPGCEPTRPRILLRTMGSTSGVHVLSRRRVKVPSSLVRTPGAPPYEYLARVFFGSRPARAEVR
jgi:hypothetical protein